MNVKETIFFEYLKCPMKAYFSGLNPSLCGDGSFKKMLTSTVKSYYSSHIYNNANISRMKKLWDSMCENNTDVITPKKALEGRGMLFRTVDYINNNNINITDINTPYTLEVPGSQISIIGHLDPFIDKGNYIEIFITSFEKTLPSITDMEMRTKHNIDAYILNLMYDKPIILTYYVPALNKTVTTTKGVQDFNKLETMIKTVGSHMKLMPYPAESFMCTSCVCKDLCKS